MRKLTILKHSMNYTICFILIATISELLKEYTNFTMLYRIITEVIIVTLISPRFMNPDYEANTLEFYWYIGSKKRIVFFK